MPVAQETVSPRERPLNALFSLVPLDEEADAVFDDPDNSDLVSILPSGRKVLDIGFHINPSSHNTLATLGRNDCDITIRHKEIAIKQCSFEIDDLSTGVVMFYDWSHSHTSKISHAEFELGRTRRMLVCAGLNTIISMEGPQGKLLSFKLEWILDEEKQQQAVQRQRGAIFRSWQDPRKARTRNDVDTVLASAFLTPQQAFKSFDELSMRHFPRQCLGKGTYGTVFRTIDLDSGRVMAVKNIPKVRGQDKALNKVKLEVEIMRRAKHVRFVCNRDRDEGLIDIQPRIAELITPQGWNSNTIYVEIFMGLDAGDLYNLVESGEFALDHVQERCVHHMLEALDFLAASQIVHRDVKPDNILYSPCLEGHWQAFNFRLADFGVSKFNGHAISYQGTE